MNIVQGTRDRMSIARAKTMQMGAGVSAANVLATVPWVAQWKFNNNGNDSVGSNTLTNNNSATFTTGILGGATGATQLVAASGQYWSITDNAALSMGAGIDFLISLWFYLDSIGITRPLLDKSSSAFVAANTEYTMYIYGVDQKIYFHTSNGASLKTVGPSAVVTLSTWHHVVVWFNSSAGTLNMKLDNAATVTTTSVPDTQDSNKQFNIGMYGSLQSYMDGRVDNVCIAKGTGAVPTQAVLDALWNGGAGTETLT